MIVEQACFIPKGECQDMQAERLKTLLTYKKGELDI